MRPALLACLTLLIALAPTCSFADGTLDPNFGDAGRRLVGYLESDQVQTRGMARSPNNSRIWLVGDERIESATISLARLMADGQPDPSFGPNSDGRVRTTLPATLIPQTEAASLRGIAMRSDGKPILYGGLVSAAGEGGAFPGFVCRINVAGNLDTGFSGDGCQLLQAFSDPDESCVVADVAIASDDTVIVVGNCVADGLIERPFLARLTASGALDTEFGGGSGVVLPTIPQASVFASHFDAVIVHPDHRIAVAGTFSVANSGITDLDVGVAQFDAGGSFDTSFSSDGFVSLAFDLGGDNHDRARDLVRRADGELLVLGESRTLNPLRTHAVLALLRTNGTLDDAFGMQGQLADALGDLPYEARIQAVDVDAQGRVIVAANAVLGTPEAAIDVGTDFQFTLLAGAPPNAASTLMVAADTPVSGTLTSPALAQPIAFSAAPGAPAMLTVPGSLFEPEVGNGTIHLKSLRLTATGPVTLTTVHGRSFSLDSTVIRPTHTLGRRYRLMSWGPGLGVGSEVSIAATVDNTTVRITPKAALAGHPAGVPFSVTLDQGEVYQARVDVNDADLTGTIVGASAPVAVFSGNSCANVPLLTTDYCDFAYEQSIPIDEHAYGHDFVAIPGRDDGDVLRILALEPDTEVRLDGQLVATLNAGQQHTVLRSNPVWINTSRPTSVAQFGRGCELVNGGQEGQDCPGDPYMLRIEPRTRWATDQRIAVLPPSFPADATTAITVVVASADVASVRIDGQAIGASFAAVAGTPWSSARFTRPVGAYRLTADSPMMVTMTGLGQGEAFAQPGNVLGNGSASGGLANARELVARLTPQGERDLRFGDQGVAIIADAEHANAPIRVLADGDGILVASASTHTVAGQRLLLVSRIAAGHLFADGFE